MPKTKYILLLFLLSSFFFPSYPTRAQEGGAIYIVQPGDSLYSIAARFGVSLDELLAVNGISDPNTLAVGQQLTIPGLEGINGILDTKFINFGDSYRGLMRQTQVHEDLFRRLNHVVSPGEFYVGANMIVPIQNQTQYAKRVSPAVGESLLELAVKNNTDVQGGTGVISIVAQPGVSLGGALVDRPLHFFPDQDGVQTALQGVHALLEPGVHPLRLEATLPDGSVQSYEQLILIVSGNYPEDPLLYVDPATIDPASTEPELQQLISITTPATPNRLWVGDFISPAIAYAESTYFTSRFGNRRTYIGQGTTLSIQGFHTGLDFGGGEGYQISAPAAGVVAFAGPWTVRGNATVIDHGWGVYSGIWHQSKIDVQVGQSVNKGDVIGLVGGTGRVTGAHLHWELWVNGIQVDPLDWLNQTYP
ncbi:MAG: peptidoglycan DD-metalloendopeptidase family protein [Anaerolineales bacterium]|nr:peptidoglycan DD-metalloendopeptidase family protein [Anaerolineales bacterium]